LTRQIKIILMLLLILLITMQYVWPVLAEYVPAACPVTDFIKDIRKITFTAYTPNAAIARIELMDNITASITMRYGSCTRHWTQEQKLAYYMCDNGRWPDDNRAYLIIDTYYHGQLLAHKKYIQWIPAPDSIKAWQTTRLTTYSSTYHATQGQLIYRGLVKPSFLAATGQCNNYHIRYINDLLTSDLRFNVQWFNNTSPPSCFYSSSPGIWSRIGSYDVTDEHHMTHSGHGWYAPLYYYEFPYSFDVTTNNHYVTISTRLSQYQGHACFCAAPYIVRSPYNNKLGPTKWWRGSAYTYTFNMPATFSSLLTAYVSWDWIITTARNLAYVGTNNWQDGLDYIATHYDPEIYLYGYTPYIPIEINNTEILFKPNRTDNDFHHFVSPYILEVWNVDKTKKVAMIDSVITDENTISHIKLSQGTYWLHLLHNAYSTHNEVEIWRKITIR